MATSFSDLINDRKPVLIDFFAEWCGPCKSMKSILDDLKNRVGENARVLKIDVDKNPELAAKYGIRGVPTLMIFKGGQMVWRQSGVIPAAALESEIRKHY